MPSRRVNVVEIADAHISRYEATERAADTSARSVAITRNNLKRIESPPAGPTGTANSFCLAGCCDPDVIATSLGEAGAYSEPTIDRRFTQRNEKLALSCAVCLSSS